MDTFKITQIGRVEIELLKKEVDEALEKIKSKYQLATFNVDQIKFSPTSIQIKISGSIENEATISYKDTEARVFCMMNGLPENLIGTEFTLRDEDYLIDQIEVKNTKYPIIASNLFTNKSFKFSVDEIKRLIQHAGK
jgi:hypothetical protein